MSQDLTSFGSSSHCQQCTEHLGETQTLKVTDVWSLAHGNKFVPCKTWFSLKWTRANQDENFSQRIVIFLHVTVLEESS